MLAYVGKKCKHAGESLNLGLGNSAVCFLVVQACPNAVVQLVVKIYAGFKSEEVANFCNKNHNKLNIVKVTTKDC